MYRAEEPPAPVKKMSKGELGDLRVGPEIEAQSECVPMLTRPEWWGSVSQGLEDARTRIGILGERNVVLERWCCTGRWHI
jgi:hypothetical protein